MKLHNSFTFQEFFAGGGMVRQALGEDWTCNFANDFDGKKALTYQENWGTCGELFVGDIREIDSSYLDKPADLAWASFPCQDLSLAGAGKGLKSERSGMFYVFWKKLSEAARSQPYPNIVVIENVCGMLTSNNGNDFQEVIKAFVQHGYYVGGLVLDAKDFVPQSRKRVFIIGIRNDKNVDPVLVTPEPSNHFHTPALIRAYERLESSLKSQWIWFNLPRADYRKNELIDLLEDVELVVWNSYEKTQSILNKMSAINKAKVQAAKYLNKPVAGAVFMRTRMLKGEKKVFAEIRFDGISGCLRTPNGGSSRQGVLWVNGDDVRSRLLTPRETARLMGLPEKYKLPKNNNTALHLTGDGVVVPVVEHLKNYLLEPLISELNYRNVDVSSLYKYA
jgi:DNA (cytosine-5)-methyltransferase 1